MGLAEEEEADRLEEMVVVVVVVAAVVEVEEGVELVLEPVLELWHAYQLA